MNIHYVPNQLFVRPSFVEGIARLLDFGATLQEYNGSRTPEEADMQALANDWRAVGDDLKGVIKTYERQESAKQTRK